MQGLNTDQPVAQPSADGGAAAADHPAAAAAVADLEARVAELHKEAQRLNKIAGQEEAAAAVYKQLAALDDQALHLQLHHALPVNASQLAAHDAAHPQFCRLLAPAPAWADVAAADGARCSAAQLRGRALHAVLGHALGDAAACSVQWVYSEAALQTLAQGRDGLEFFDPPQCPFFDYALGSSSPYGEQTAALAQSLVKAGGLDCCRYAADLFAAFGPGFEGYRDRSTKSFLRRYAAGQRPPQTGSPDDQANAFTRLPPLVALYAGGDRGHLLAAVECMIRVTQNDPIAVAYGCAAALVLEAVLLGASVAAAVAATADWLQQKAGAAEPAQAQAAALVPPHLWGEVAEWLLQAAELAPLPPLEAAAQLGRNCHLPNSLQTPLQVLLHMEWKQASNGGPAVQQPDDQPPAGGQQPDDQPPAGGQQSTAAAEAAAAEATTAEGSAAGDDFCLPCSMGGTACPLPAWPASQRAAPGSALLQALVRQQQQQQQQAGESPPASLAPEAFVEAVRMAIRPGGCCASRAGFVGALAGALAAGSSSSGGSGGERDVLLLPHDWMRRVQGWDGAAQLAQQLTALRD